MKRGTPSPARDPKAIESMIDAPACFAGSQDDAPGEAVGKAVGETADETVGERAGETAGETAGEAAGARDAPPTGPAEVVRRIVRAA